MKKLKTLFVILLLPTVFSLYAADVLLPSQNPPSGLHVSQVPQFISIGFDDNSMSGWDGSEGTGGMKWVIDYFATKKNPAGMGNPGTFDGTPVRATFLLSTTYIENWTGENPNYLKIAWRQAYENGHEIGNHTNNHSHGETYTVAQWVTEINDCNEWLTKEYGIPPQIWVQDNTKGIGIPLQEIYGFRSPFLEYADNTYTALQQAGLVYDCSIEEGFDGAQDGSNYYWPYTLDEGSPGNDLLVEWGTKQPIYNHPGLWELPIYCVIVPPDDVLAEYGLTESLRQKCKSVQSWFDVTEGKITGYDFNLFVQFKMSQAEFAATMKYTLDQRLKGNRAPFIFGGHTEYYSSKKVPTDYLMRQAAMEDFVDYALSKPDVRIVPMKSIVDWCRSPVSLNGGAMSPTPTVMPTATPTPSAPQLLNIAVGKNVVASSIYAANFSATNTVDGNKATIWGSSVKNDQEWIYIDLGKVRDINGVALDWFDQYYAKTYSIAVSLDGKNWSFVYEETKGNGGLDKLMGTGRLRYIGFLFRSKNNLAYAIKEIEVYGTY